MDPTLRIVIDSPLTELWTHGGPLRATRLRELSPSDLAVALGKGPLLSPTRIVVADVGLPLRWLSGLEIPAFWKAEAQGRIVGPSDDRFRLTDFPGEYCFRVSEWREQGSESSIYLFEKYH